MLHSTISQHRYGNIFHNPIKKTEAPDYHDIVKRPMDLKTIKARVKDGLIANSLEFQRDIYLMFANAMMYNRPGSDVHNMAEEVSGFWFGLVARGMAAIEAMTDDGFSFFLDDAGERDPYQLFPSDGGLPSVVTPPFLVAALRGYNGSGPR